MGNIGDIMYEYIEFISLPGSGKSTISNSLVMELNKYDLNYNNATFNISRKNKILRVLYKFYFCLIIFFKENAIFKKSLKKIIKTNQKTLVDLIKVTTNYFYVYGVITDARSKSKKIVLDQGIIQAIWSINYSANNRIKLSELLNDNVQPNYIIQVECKLDIIKERLKKRKKLESRMEEANFNNYETIINNYNSFIEDVREIISKENINIIILKNEVPTDIEKNVQIILKKFKIGEK